MNALISASFCYNFQLQSPLFVTQNSTKTTTLCNRRFRVQASNSNGSDAKTALKDSSLEEEFNGGDVTQLKEEQKFVGEGDTKSSATPLLEKDLKKVVQKTAATFAPRASVASKNPAVPGTVLYTVFEVQGYASMLLGGVLSFNLLFPSNEPDLWRLMGMWSIWMFTIPSLRARDCSKNEKEALNYLFLLIPLLNVTIPFFWKSFAIVWSADTVAFFGMYAWKMGWLQNGKTK
ncbi:OLC1v1025830C2 [Oldenlandia corymbosa var. corymbosa]|uniref:OLC1v1025830C2 n=1 Tax=Oldenlandia corymbosa var. corymbosa TaxID=529605 RepID=A0AAV1C5T1_OLDCO|nr:OLC1v1025830C2 [Oldenlandia corymbosa var. corymbosa]